MNANKIVKKKTNEKNEKYAKKCVKKLFMVHQIFYVF